MLTVNEGKRAEITFDGETYLRFAIRTRFITTGDDYLQVIRQYAQDVCRPGDILSISEKIVSLCQGRVVRREQMRVGRWARFLSCFAQRDAPSGPGVGLPIKMQYAIDKVGLPRVLLAAAAGGLCKLFGVRGVFYRIAGRAVSGLDGFYGRVWQEYADLGIEIPDGPDRVCDEIRQTLGIRCMIVDANDLGQVILGKCADIGLSDRALLALIRDNPAGQGRQRTPLVLIRKKENAAAPVCLPPA